MKPTSSLFAKILSWFFLNLVVVAGLLTVFFAFQPHVNLHALFGQQGLRRLQAAGMSIAYDLSQTARAEWSNVLARHAAIQRIDFVLIVEDGSCFSSTKMDIPERVIARVRHALRPKPPWDRRPPPDLLNDAPRPPENYAMDDTGQLADKRSLKRKPPWHADWYDKRPPLMFRTHNPTLYWTGIPIPISLESPRPPNAVCFWPCRIP